MKPAELFSTFKEGSLHPLYYFYGEDQKLLDLAVQCVEKQGGFEKTDALAYDIYYGGTTSLITILESARSLPFLGAKKLVVVKETEKISASDREKLFAYSEKPSRKSTVIFAERLLKTGRWRVKKASFSKKLQNAFQERGMVLFIPQPAHSEILSWIKYFAKTQGKTITDDGAVLLRDLVGQSIQDLAAAVEKLALFVGGEDRIMRTAVEQSISRLRVESVFELADYVGAGKRKEALGALNRLLESSEEPLFILSMIARQFRMILTAQTLLDQGASSPELKKGLGVQDFVLKKVVPQARAFSRTQLESCYEQLWRADRSLKSKRTSQRVLLEQLVLDLCG